MNKFCVDAVDPESPMIVPGSMSPTGKIFSNQSLWSMSIQFDKQVNCMLNINYQHNIMYNIIMHASKLGALQGAWAGCYIPVFTFYIL